MTERRRILVMAAVLAAVAISVGSITTAVLYRVAIGQQRERLREVVQSRARLFEAMARFDALHCADLPGGPVEATISQIRQAHGQFKGFGRTGEFTLGRLTGGRIEFLLSHRHLDPDPRHPLPPDSALAEPMRRALAGQSGTMIGLDYRGERVLAAYEPVAVLGLGVVAKIDLAEVRSRYLWGGIISGLATLFLVGIGSTLVVRLGNPIARRAEESLRQLEELNARNEAILEAVPDIVMEVDDRKIYTWANRTGLAFFGDDVVGHNASDYFIGEQDTYEKVLPLFGGLEEVLYVESVQRRRDGAERLLAWWCRVLKDAGGKVTGAVSTARDITEARAAEKAVLRHKDELEQRVAARTAELADANRELEAFAYSVSHDLRAPLRAVNGFARMIEEDYGEALDDEGRRRFRVIRDSVRDMGDLIDDLLRFSRLSRADVKMADVDLASLVEEVRERLNDEIGDRNIRFEVGPLPPARGDHSLLRELLLNLIQNAVKYTRPRREARIEVSGKRDGHTVTFTVRDNGVGFDQRYADTMFEVFQRLHRQDEFEGTGIGLALCRRIVHRHSGQIWAEGRLNEGAAFHFKLNAAEGERREGCEGGGDSAR